MKPINYTGLWIIVALCAFVGGLLIGPMVVLNSRPNVNLPEEYKLITHADCLRGAYDSASNTLTIEFDNPKNK